jgi:cyanophycin synthetase
VTSDHLGLAGIESLDELARVKQVVVEAVARDGAAVLNAEDRLVAEMAAANRGDTLYFARSAGHPVLASHLASGGRGVSVEDGWIVLHEGRSRTPVLELARVPLTAGGRIGFQVQNALAATGAAWAVGVNPAILARGLSTFGESPLAVPGRFNRFDVDGVELVLDYAHNRAAMLALGEALTALGRRRTFLVVGLPGDRRDEDLVATIEATRGFADVWLLHDLADRRGREQDAVPELLRRALGEEAVCHVLPCSRDASGRAMELATPGDRVVVIADEVDDLVAALPALGLRTGLELACSGNARRHHEL